MDYIVAGLAILIICGMFVRLYAVVFMGKQLSERVTEITGNLLSDIMMVISMYVGARIIHKYRDKDD